MRSCRATHKQFVYIMDAFEADLNVDKESFTAALVGFGSALTLMMVMYTYVASQAVASLLCYSSCDIDCGASSHLAKCTVTF